MVCGRENQIPTVTLVWSCSKYARELTTEPCTWLQESWKTKGHVEAHDSEGQTGEAHRRGREGACSGTEGTKKFHHRPMGHLKPDTGISK